METLNALYNLMSLVFVLSTLASMGLNLTVAQVTGPVPLGRSFRNPAIHSLSWRSG